MRKVWLGADDTTRAELRSRESSKNIRGILINRMDDEGDDTTHMAQNATGHRRPAASSSIHHSLSSPIQRTSNGMDALDEAPHVATTMYTVR